MRGRIVVLPSLAPARSARLEGSWRMRLLTLFLMFTLACLGPDDADLHSDGWPGWRGPGGTGVAVEADLPLEWGPDKNVLWKAPVEGR